MNGTPRQIEAITTHDRSLVVTAGAGTGKTHVLITKYLNLLETFGEGKERYENPISVRNILALTFTDKAAAEMKERIRKSLDEKQGEFWEKTRAEFLITPVQTFHSFCAQVLREFAFEAQVEPSFVVLDEQEASRILTSCFQDLIHAPSEEGDVVYALATVGAYNLEQMIRTLYPRRDEAERFFESIRTDQDGTISFWQDEIRAYRESEAEKIRGNCRFRETVRSLIAFALMDTPSEDKAMIYLQKVRPFLEVMDSDGTADEFLDAATRYLKVKLGTGGSKKLWTEELLSELRETYKELNEMLDRAPAVAAMRFDPGDQFSIRTIRFLNALGTSFARFCELVEEEKAAAGGIDFADLIRSCRQLFRDHQGLVAEHYKRQFRYILVDEFQDTDPAQFEIVTAIAGTPGPDLQSLFIVGDPKQSIYLFREADVTRFRDASSLITNNCSGKEISLDVCFRSSPAVITFVNILFAGLFQSVEKPWEFPYEPALVSDERDGHAGTVSLLLTHKDGEVSEPEAVADEILAIVRDHLEVYEEGERDGEGLRTFTTRPAIWRDIAILLERRTNLGEFLHALGRRKIPYYVHKGSGFYQRQEILDLINLLTFLLKPYDDISLVGLLRSPYIGMKDTDIIDIRRSGRGTFFERLQKRGESCHAAARAYDLLDAWRGRAGRWRVTDLIQSVLDESGIFTVYGGLAEGQQILSNIRKLQEMVRAQEEKGRYQLADLVADLSEAVKTGDQEGEAMIDDPGLDAVRIMTIHAAKGLEFPVVFVPEMGQRSNQVQPPVLMEGPGPLMGVRIPDPEDDFETAETPVYSLLKNRQEEKLLAEKKRLLYVALTRAADHLIMSSEIGDELPDGSKDTRLDWIWRELGITGNVIEAGEIHIRSPDGRELSMRIVKPGQRLIQDEQKLPPFTIPDELRDEPGRFVLRQIPGKPSRSPLLVTEIAKAADEPSGQQHEGYGAGFGTAIHEVLRGNDPEMVIREWGITDPDLQQELKETLERFESLPELIQRVQIKRELAFTVTIGGAAVTGRIDCIIQNTDGSWLVIDYKSDTLSGSELCEKKVYRIQTEIYRQAAETLGMKPATAALYGIFEGKLIHMNPDEKDAAIEIIHQAWSDEQNNIVNT
ncbi:MAG TPA: UvrD-helicase domain-containing protein [Methanospirillum sp.]|uniref:UvrD-helicase domain-containing protein n=1 Tax=Methanospirillum sp. TaxID=45200 RepID=UPI002CA4E154|nr:UvrD-helicase domain-containing protein [Methanospirillum sp.]HWQ62781.1 UvrD-helicase domain-containing protein [Methanospirillum sp.]